MDPNATLKEIRDIVRLRGGLNNDDNAFDRLLELVEALDNWLSRGGFLPEAWKQHDLRIATDAPC